MVAPTGDPLEELDPLQHDVAVLVLAVAVVLHDPLDELPVERGKQFLLMRRAGVEINQVGQRLLLLARAGAEEVELGD